MPCQLMLNYHQQILSVVGMHVDKQGPAHHVICPADANASAGSGSCGASGTSMLDSHLHGIDMFINELHDMMID